MVLDPDIVKQILVANYGSNPQFAKNLYMLKRLLGKGLITLEGPDWQRHRRICNPSFQPKIIQKALEDAAPIVVKEVISYWKQAGSRGIDISKHLSNLTLDILGKVAFAHEFHALESIKNWAEQDNSSNGDHLIPVSDKLYSCMNYMFKNLPRIIFLRMFHLTALDFKTKNNMMKMNEATNTVVDIAR
eukprot:CAMPEP_0178901010 /NCGR_PEP_ID=MMETSP0786-20121207/3780_1 /TAXON_ID=186022 /ORGANISM="Thalassionema frauenfeldii, Strain CCMP 1798" /LENGTH=187 /DNA_ID=CAMNT_0020572055 /DNA_START=257 /DNA_END=817 /DNA_ORIENTATION=+